VVFPAGADCLADGDIPDAGDVQARVDKHHRQRLCPRTGTTQAPHAGDATDNATLVIARPRRLAGIAAWPTSSQAEAAQPTW